MHEPLIIGGSGVPKGETIDALTEMVDLGATLFDISSLKPDYPIDGRSLLPLINKELSKVRDFSVSEGGFLLSEELIIEYATFPYDLKAQIQHDYVEYVGRVVGRVVALRDHNFTFVYRLYEKNELYLRRNDPQELHNLTDDQHYSKETSNFKQLLLKFLVESSDYAPLKTDNRFSKVKLKSPKEQ